MLTGNYNPTKIIEIANSDWGFLTAKRHRSGGKPLADSMIYKMFNNKFYCGIVCYSGKEYQGAHEPMVTLDEFDRVQVLLGNKSKSKPQVREFSFTGIIHCGTCGCFVTAEEKNKFYKTTKNTGNYVYYRCSRRRKPKLLCREPAITKEAIEQQIEKELLKFTIDPEFRDFALSKLRRNNDKEIEMRTQARTMLQNTYNETQNQLDNLTKMRYRDLIDDTTFSRERELLQKELTKTQQRLNETHDSAAQWLELTERAFHFATNAYAIFKAGDLKTKREIFNAIGTSYVLKNMRLTLEQQEWIVPISNELESIKIDIRRLELLKNSSIDEKTPALAEVHSRWGD